MIIVKSGGDLVVPDGAMQGKGRDGVYDTVRLWLPQPTLSLNEWQRMNRWERATYASSLDQEILVARDSAPDLVRPEGPWRVRLMITRFGPRFLDRDNLVGGMKPLIDALGRARLIPWTVRRDGRAMALDDPGHLLLDVLQEGGRGNFGATVEIGLRVKGRFRDPDVTAIQRAVVALSGSTSRQTLEANLRFLWDYFVAHPSPGLPKHLRPPNEKETP